MKLHMYEAACYLRLYHELTLHTLVSGISYCTCFFGLTDVLGLMAAWSWAAVMSPVMPCAMHLQQRYASERDIPDDPTL